MLPTLRPGEPFAVCTEAFGWAEKNGVLLFRESFHDFFKYSVNIWRVKLVLSCVLFYYWGRT